MAKLFIEDTTLASIGTAIREKTGKSELINPTQMPEEIRSIETGGSGGEVFNEWTCNETNAFSSGMSIFSNNKLNKWIDGKDFTINLSNSITLLFSNSNELVDLSKTTINLTGANGQQAFRTFNKCGLLEKLPKLNVLQSTNSYNFCNMFDGCGKLRNIDDDFWQAWWSLKTTGTQAFQLYGIFLDCLSLRQLPDMTVMDDIITSQTTVSRHLYYQMVNNCYCLDTIEHVPVLNTTKDITSNMFEYTFDYCCRVKDIIFATNEDGTPIARNWSNQTINLTSYTGFAYSYGYITSEQRNAGITMDKYVNSDATYQALKDDPDWFSDKIEYSRYNHDSAVRTINSLPDCSSGTNNKIKFKGASGSATDGGAISNLTEEEIAVATAKGWTVEIV